MGHLPGHAHIHRLLGWRCREKFDQDVALHPRYLKGKVARSHELTEFLEFSHASYRSLWKISSRKTGITFKQHRNNSVSTGVRLFAFFFSKFRVVGDRKCREKRLISVSHWEQRPSPFSFAFCAELFWDILGLPSTTWPSRVREVECKVWPGAGTHVLLIFKHSPFSLLSHFPQPHKSPRSQPWTLAWDFSASHL